MSGSRFRAVRKRPFQEVPRGRNDETWSTSKARTDEQSNQENKRRFHGSLKEWTTDHRVGQQLGLALSTRGSRAGKMQRLSVNSDSNLHSDLTDISIKTNIY